MDGISFSTLPPGFGFHPTDVELVSHYLKKKIHGQKFEFEIIPEVDIYKCEPWDLPAKSHVPTRDSTWHFFNARDKKYPNGSRANRATVAGYWKSTGKDRIINVKKHAIGTKKTLVFHKGRPPHGKRSDWIMHEYHLSPKECGANPSAKDLYVLCRVTKRDELASKGEESTRLHENNNHQEKSEEVMPGESSPSDNIDEILLAELFDPNPFGDSTSMILKTEPKEDIHSVPKQGPAKSSSFFLPNASDASPPLFGDSLDFNVMDFLDPEMLEGLDTNFIEDTPGSEDVFLGLPTFGGPLIEVNSSSISFGTLERTENSPAIESAETGIQIRERRRRPPTEISKQRIRLQMDKMESRNRGPDNHIFEHVTQDRYVESVDGSITTSVSDPAFGEAKKNMPPAFYSFLSLENSQESSEVEDIPPAKLLRRKLYSKLPDPDKIPSSHPDDRNGIKETTGGVFKFFRRFSSAVLSCLFLLGTAALVVYFLLRDARRFLNTVSCLGL